MYSEINCGTPSQHDQATVAWNKTTVKSEAVYSCLDNSTIVIECTDQGWNYPSNICDPG